MSSAQVANWLAHLATSSTLSSASIANYKSGARNWYLRNTQWSAAANPFDSEIVRVALGGIQRGRTPAELAARRERPMTRSIGPAILAELRPLLETGSETSLGIWAAACLGAHALLRGGELLGAGARRDRALRLDQIAFFRSAGAPHRVALAGADPARTPHRFSIALGITKADQIGDNAPITVDAPLAVDALWRWSLLRRSFAPESPLLFVLPSGRPLAMATLLHAIEKALLNAGHGPHRLTSKCFRRGGAGEMVAAGFTAEAIAAVGRWRSGTAMVVRYAGQAALAQRASAVARGLRPAL